MHRADAAEWILSLTTSREHAASIAGDLAQQSPHYGAIWFWTSLIRTTTSLTWRAFAEAPLRVTGLAFMGMFLQIVWMLLITIPIFFVRFAFLITLRAHPEQGSVGMDLAVSTSWESIVAFFVASLWIGKWIARKAPERELVVYVGVWFIAHVLWTPMVLVISGGSQMLPSLSDLAIDIVATVGGALCAFVGVKRMRRKLSSASV